MVVDPRIRRVVSLEDPKTGSLPSVTREYLLTLKLDFKSIKTIDSYSIRLRLFNEYLVSAKLPNSIKALNTYAIRSFIGHLTDRKLSPVTISGYYRCLHSFFKWCEREQLIKLSPMININPPRLPKTIVNAFSPKDIEDILTLCEGEKYTAIRNRSLVLMFLDTGLRLAEMAGIQMKDVNIEAGIIKVMGKGSRERVVGLGTTTHKALLKYLRYRNTGLTCLWQTEEKRALTIGGVQQIIQRLCELARITDARGSPHTFRHTSAMLHLKNGASIFDLKAKLGHSKVETTQRYLNSYTSDVSLETLRKFSPVDNL